MTVSHREVVADVQREVLPYDRNYLRDADRLGPALHSLHGTWSVVREGLGASGEEAFRAREAAAVVAHGRWMYHAALHRTESGGMHKRVDRPAQDPAQHYRLLTGGLDEVWSRPESVPHAMALGGGRAA
ncbi:hypothetical protein [Streptomyces sp. NPDC002889]|uniref:hypothetical protein n=1 Tax=Streptomyces sp. NPDC002889 TaxID=3364669 RepID=UPI003691C688